MRYAITNSILTIRDIITKFSGNLHVVKRKAKLENGYVGVGVADLTVLFTIVITRPPTAGHSAGVRI